MSKIKNLAGNIFGELTAIEIAFDKAGKRRRWKCLCSCGNIAFPLTLNLIRGRTKSCGCKRSTDLTDKKVGKLTVIKPTNSRSGSCIKWLCKCECGNFTKVNSHALKGNKTRSCGCTRSPNLIGKTFGLLTVIKRGKTRNRQRFWICKCKCGNTVNISSGNLNYTNWEACGAACLIKARLAPLRNFYSMYKRAAKEYDRKFSITFEEFVNIVCNPCEYCEHPGTDKGIPFRKNRKNARKKNKRKKKNLNSRMKLKDVFCIANGVDRVDSLKGYTKENCVPCCRPCNVAKLDRTQEEFIKHAYRIVAKQERLKGTK